MDEKIQLLLSDWQNEIESYLLKSNTLCIAIFSLSRKLIYVNPAFTDLFKSEPDKSFVNPKFDTFLASPDTDTLIYEGLITIGSEYYGNSNISGKVYKKNDQFLIVGEVDIRKLTEQYNIMLSLNQENTNLQRKLIKEKSVIKREITARKIAEERIQNLLREKEIILKEVHHRVKNNMNTIYGFLYLQAEITENPETEIILMDAAGGVQSMMQLYNKLYRSDNIDAISIKEYLPSLINEVVSIFLKKTSIKIETKIDDIILNVEVLFPLGIIINELITNSMKYAFTGRTDGVLTLKAHKIEQRVSLTYEDNGSGIPESVTFENATGFGLTLISLLVKQINGSIAIERNNGTKYVIEFDV